MQGIIITTISHALRVVMLGPVLTTPLLALSHPFVFDIARHCFDNHSTGTHRYPQNLAYPLAGAVTLGPSGVLRGATHPPLSDQVPSSFSRHQWKSWPSSLTARATFLEPGGHSHHAEEIVLVGVVLDRLGSGPAPQV
jgi:hypothetical protein